MRRSAMVFAVATALIVAGTTGTAVAQDKEKIIAERQEAMKQQGREMVAVRNYFQDKGDQAAALAAWMIVDDAVKDQPYLAGASLSLAEIVLGTQIYRWFNFPIERPSLDNLRAWYDRLRQRPGFKTHIETAIT